MNGDPDSIVRLLMRETEIIFTGRSVKISPEAPLAELGFDSMSLVELLVSIERHFGVKMMEIGLSPEDLKSLNSLALRVSQVI